MNNISLSAFVIKWRMSFLFYIYNSFVLLCLHKYLQKRLQEEEEEEEIKWRNLQRNSRKLSSSSCFWIALLTKNKSC